MYTVELIYGDGDYADRVAIFDVADASGVAPIAKFLERERGVVNGSARIVVTYRSQSPIRFTPANDDNYVDGTALYGHHAEI